MYHVEHTVAHIPLRQYVEEYRDSERFIGCCRACDKYGACWACPPYDFDTEEYIAPYTEAYVIGSKVVMDTDTLIRYTGDDVIIPLTYKIIEQVRHTVDPQLLCLESIYSGRAFYAGTCHICPLGACTRRQGLPCIAPDRVRPSLEALGFDIGKSTTDLLGIELQWSRDGILPAYLTLVSGFFATELIPSSNLGIEFYGGIDSRY